MNIIIEGIIFELQRVGGISRLYHELLPRLCFLDEEVDIKILTGNSLLQELPYHQNIKQLKTRAWFYRFLRPEKLFSKFKEYIRINNEIKLISNIGKSIWHATYYDVPNRWNGARIVTVYDLIYELFPDYFNNPMDEFIRTKKKNAVLNSEKVICISEATRHDVIQFYGIPEEKTETIYLSAGSAFHKIINEKPFIEKPFLIYVGLRVHYKNFHNLLIAFSKWNRKDDIDLLVIGKPWTVEEKDKILEYNIEKNVRIMTDITDFELCKYYNNAVALVYPSLYEGFGIPLLEASACGCPLVASNIPSTREIIGQQAFYFDPLDIESIINALNDSLTSTHEKNSLVIANDYSWDRAALKTLNLYKKML